MKLGVVESVLRCHDDAATFAQAQRLGFAGVEISLLRDQLRDPAQTRLARLKQLVSQTGIAVPSLMLGKHNDGGIANPDTAVSAPALDDIRQAIGWARELGAQVILVPFFFRGDIITGEDFERAVQGFREVCPLAQQHGIMLCYEGTLSHTEIRRMANEVDSPSFGCYFDLANVVWRGMDTATEIYGLGNLITQVHMKETRVGPGDVPPGIGRVDYAASARALQEIGYDGWLVLETPAAPAELVQRDISFTRRWFPSLRQSREFRTGAFSYGFKRGQWDDMIRAFNGAGMTAVQLGSDLLAEALEEPERIPQLRDQLERNDIQVVALAGYRNLVAADPAKRRANIDFLKRCLEYAPLFGTAVVATETGTTHPDSDWQPTPANWDTSTWQQLYEVLEELLPVAEQSGAILALEGYVNNVVQTVGQMTGLLERYPTKHLQVVLDPFNYLNRHLLPARHRIVSDFLHRFEHRFVLAHLKDVSAEGAEVDTPEFGQGVFPHRLYFDFLREHRPDLPLILEHLPFDHIPAAIRRIHETMQTEPEPK